MSKLNILPQLTRSYILQRITQEEIMEYYTGIEVNEYTLIGNSFISPMRIDNNPTCNYYYAINKNQQSRLKLRDWNGSFHGDIFDVASYYTKIQINSAQGFNLLLHKIAYDFNIHKYTNGIERMKLEGILEEYTRRIELKIFKVIPRKWNEYDKRYWADRFGIGSDLLRLGKVIPVDILEIEGKDGYFHKQYKYIAKDPAYAYYGGKVNGIIVWKIYFPLREGRRRFLTNYAFIQGLDIFEPCKIGIITKSLKDVLTFKTLGVQAIGIPSETYLMSKDEYFDLNSKADILFTNFDYDKAGILLANKYKKVHNCYPIMFTKGRFNQPNFGVKDISEYRNTYGIKKSLELIFSLVESNRALLDYLDNYNYNTLQWIQTQ